MPTPQYTMTRTEESIEALEPLIRGLTPRQVRLAWWLALPNGLREPDTRRELAEELAVTPTMISRWSAMPEVVDVIVRIRDSIMRGQDTTEVLAAMARQAKLGDHNCAKVFLEAAGMLSSADNASKQAQQVTVVIDGEELTVKVAQAQE